MHGHVNRCTCLYNFHCILHFPALPLRQLSLTPPPVVYDSGTTASTGCTAASGNRLVCTIDESVITNGDNGPVNQTLPDVSGVYAWNQDVTITLTLPDNMEARVTAINLFFYNNPSMGIGLPHEIELNWGTGGLFAGNSLGHAVIGNQDLSEDDNMRRNVTIAALEDDPTDSDDFRSLGVTFRFSDVSSIRWLLLSEIEICSSPGTVYMYISKCMYTCIDFIIEIDSN